MTLKHLLAALLLAGLIPTTASAGHDRFDSRITPVVQPAYGYGHGYAPDYGRGHDRPVRSSRQGLRHHRQPRHWRPHYRYPRHGQQRYC